MGKVVCRRVAVIAKTLTAFENIGSVIPKFMIAN